MKETVVYIRVPVEQEPEVSGWYQTDLGKTYFRLLSISKNTDYEGWFTSDINMNTKVYPDFWFESTPLSSLLQEGVVEFAEWCLSNYRKYDFTREGPVWISEKDWANDNACPEEYTTSELFKLFIEEKYGK
jgi:hypothetical protein